MSSSNGQTKGIIGRRNEADSPSVSPGKGGSTTEGGIPGIQGYLQADQGTSVRGGGCERGEFTSTNTGKILGRLENLEKRFFSYVRSHQERLDLRKKESEVAEEEFAKEVADLKQDILAFMQEAEQIE